MQTPSRFKPRSLMGRLQRGGFLALVVGGILFFLMRDTVAHKFMHVDNPQASSLFASEREAHLPDLPEQWLSDFDAAKAKAAESEKMIMAVFSAEWCGPCQMMVRDIYPKPEVVSALNNWVPVYIDGDHRTDLVSQYKIDGFPTFVIMNAAGEEKGRFVGGAGSPQTFLVRLETAVNYSEKLAKAEKAALDNPNDAAALHHLGDMKMAAVEDDQTFMEAVAVYKKALVADPDNIGNIEPELAELLKKSVIADQQISAVTTQIQDAPTDATLYKKRADLRADDPMGQGTEEAIADYRKAVELDPENKTGAAGELQFHQIRAALTTGRTQPAEAEAELKAFETQNPESARLADSLIMRAFINLQTGRVNEGAEVLKTLVEKFPEHEAAESAREVLAEIQGAQMQGSQMQGMGAPTMQ